MQICREKINIKKNSIEKTVKPLKKDKIQFMCQTTTHSKFHAIQRSKHKNEIHYNLTVGKSF